MVRVRRANVILEIKDDQVERFLDMGYDVLDANGKVSQKAPLKDAGSLQIALAEARTEIAALKEEITRLKKSSTKKTSAKKTNE